MRTFAQRFIVFGLGLLVGCQAATPSELPEATIIAINDAGQPAGDTFAKDMLRRNRGERVEVALTQSFPITPGWQQTWTLSNRGLWGLENLEVRTGPQGPVLRSYFPSGSASPAVSRETGAPLGGAGFYAPMAAAPQSGMWLRYRLRFSDNFDFVRGGKLPGLYGGNGPSGGNIPDGTDGFSTRLMWRSEGEGEIYAYLPSSERYGTSIGQGTWQFRPGRWYTLEQELRLNQPGQADGRLRLWVNGRLVIDETDLVFRTVDTLQVDGLFFSTFFGGGDGSWATPHDVYIDFSDFSMTALP